MTTYGPRFITPPTDEQELYPYRPVWASLIIESVILVASAMLVYVAINLLHINIPARVQFYVALLFIALPCALWFIFSYLAERRVNLPRQHLIAIIILTMLVASAVGTPLLDQFFQVDTWLPLAPAVNRILGYTLTAGIIQGIIKYIVIRYTIWPQHFRARLDGVAYGIATGLGYATILNLQFLSSNASALPDTTAFHVFANYALHIATGIIIGYGLSETRFSNPTPIYLAIILIISSVITGITIPIHAGLVNSSLSVESASIPKPLFGLGYSVSLLIVVGLIVSGLIQNADRLEREARAGRED